MDQLNSTSTLLGSIESFAEALMADRLIKVFVGAREVPYLVSQAALRGASVYFVKAIKNEHMDKNNTGVLRFPEDDDDTWRVILFWVCKGDLPAIDQFPGHEGETVDRMQQILVDSWILADRYLVPKLQNAVMRMLLTLLDGEHMAFDVGVHALRSHSTRSILGRLACESLVEIIYGGNDADYKHEDLDTLDGVAGAIVAMGAALQSFNEQQAPSGARRVWDPRSEDSELWEEFMVTE